jgi:hypothetical protein
MLQYLHAIGFVGGVFIAGIWFIYTHWTRIRTEVRKLLGIDQEIAALHKKYEAVMGLAERLVKTDEQSVRTQDATRKSIGFQLSNIEKRLDELDEIVKPLIPHRQRRLEAQAGASTSDPANKLLIEALRGPTPPHGPLLAPLSPAPRLSNHHNAMDVERLNAMASDQGEKKSPGLDRG